MNGIVQMQKGKPMDDLISRQAAIEALDDNITLTGWGNSVAVRDYILRAKKRLQAIPAAQPERTGKWIKDWIVKEHGGGYGVRRCSECDASFQDVGYGWNYCPNCGARMEDEE